MPGLFAVGSTGVSTEPVRKAAEALLPCAHARSSARRRRYAVDDPEWRKWMNQHFYVRQGVSFDEMSEPQREAAFGLLRASLSAKGLKLSRDIMKLNHTLGELNNNDFEQYGEWLYCITVMGTPSATEPWGWQIDGHHLIINYFVLGDQVVMTPTFVGSEPVIATAGKYKGTAILQDEQGKGLAFVNALDRGAAKQGDPAGVARPATTTSARPSRTTSCSTTPACAASDARRRRSASSLLALVGRVRRQHGRRPCAA